jgi:hypothetical protein
MKIYISGVISNGGTAHPHEVAANKRRFEEAETRLRLLGHEPINPVALNPEPNLSWSDYMSRDIASLVTCRGIHLLPRWYESKGARLELHIATELNLLVFDQEMPLPVGGDK